MFPALGKTDRPMETVGVPLAQRPPVGQGYFTTDEEGKVTVLSTFRDEIAHLTRRDLSERRSRSADGPSASAASRSSAASPARARSRTRDRYVCQSPPRGHTCGDCRTDARPLALQPPSALCGGARVVVVVVGGPCGAQWAGVVVCIGPGRRSRPRRRHWTRSPLAQHAPHAGRGRKQAGRSLLHHQPDQCGTGKGMHRSRHAAEQC